MDIFYVADDRFIPQAAASCCSIFENHTDVSRLRIFVGALHVSEENKSNLRRFARSYEREIHIIEIEDIETLIPFDFDAMGWNKVAVARLAIDRLLPEDVEKVLYLDADTIVRGDLSDLWDFPMDGRVVAASPEPTADKRRRQSLCLGDHPYVNSGVLLIDLQLWRKNGTGQRILSYYRDRGGKLFAIDQDAINGALCGEIAILSPEYNYFNVFDVYPYRVLRKVSQPAPFLAKEDFASVRKNPVIIHYLGEERPWRKGNRHLFSDDYHRYLDKTPWQSTPMEEGWTLYFSLFYLFDFIMRPVPALRYKIINSLIPAFLKFRKARLEKRVS